MLKFNPQSQILSVLLLPILVLTGCTLPEPQEKPSLAVANIQRNASFTAQSMADRSKALETIAEGNFKLPSSKVFNLQACLKDVAYDRPIVGHDFLVRTENGSIKTTSDKLGCITWSEKIHYNFLAESQYIRIEREIQGLGLHKGVQAVAFAINPWSHGENLAPVLNPEDGNTIPRMITESKTAGLALQGLSADSQQVKRGLWVDDGRFFVTEQKMTTDGVSLLVELRPNPSIQLTKMNGEMFLRPLTSGKFKARMKLIHVYQYNNQEIRRLLAETAELNIKMENASLAIKAPVLVPALPTRGQIVLGLELEPQDGPAGLSKFEGIYLLGDYDQLKGASFLKLNTVVSETKDFKLSNFINAQLTETHKNSETGSVDEETYQKPKVEVAQLEFRFVRVGEESTSTRQVVYNIRACVRSGLDQKLTRSHSFTVTKFKQSASDESKTVTIKTDNNSCLNWDESITFKYFDCQRYLKGFVEIQNENLGMKEKLEIIVNPWEAQGVLARDMRYVDRTEKLILNCSKEDRPKTQLLMDGFNYNTVSYDYSIDRYMNLQVTKKIQMRIEPRILIYSSLSGGRGDIERLRDGIYLLRTAVVQNRDYDTRNTYVTSADRLVNVMNGQVNTEITYQVSDLKALGNRNTMIVELYPVHENKVEFRDGQILAKDKSSMLEDLIDHETGLETPSYTGPITLNTDEASRPLRILDASSVTQFFIDGKGPNNTAEKNIIQSIVDAGKNVRQQVVKNIHSQTQKNWLSQTQNLEIVNLTELQEENSLTQKLTGESRLAKHLRIHKSDLKGLLNGSELAPVMAQKLCAFWSSDYMPTLKKEKGGGLANMSNTLGFDCYSAVRKNPSAFFQFEKQTLVKDVAGSRLIKGFNQGLTVGNSFSLSFNHSTTQSRSTSVGVKAGLSKKFLDLFSVGLDVGYTMSWATADSQSAGNSMSVSSNTSMVVQHNMFQVRLKRYEQCAIVRLNPSLFIKDSKTWFARRDYVSTLNHRLTEDEKAEVATRGLMICEGQDRTEEKDVVENYYLVVQESSSSQFQDNGDARNRNFFVALRSKQAFDRFVLATKGSPTPQSASKSEDNQAETTNRMEELFKLGSPATPGIFLN